MLITLKKKQVAYGIEYKPGEVLEVRDEIGLKWIKSGKAEDFKKKPKKQEKKTEND